jgi:protein TonB
VQQVVSYPLAARRRGISGTVEIEALIDEAGRVRDVRVLTSSSHAVLDEAAMEALRRVPPVPFPADVPPRRLTVRLPLVFDLK